MTRALQYLLQIIFSVVPLLGVASPKTIFKIAVEPWALYSQEDGVGLYHELWKETFKDSDFEPVIEFVPYSRSLLLFENGEVDGIGGAYEQSISRAHIVPKWHMGQSYISVFTKKGEVTRFTGMNQLQGESVIWLRDYDFDKVGVINVPVKLTEVSGLLQAFEMLRFGRATYLLDYAAEYDHLVTSKKLPEDEFTIFRDVIEDTPYHFVLQKNEVGEQVRLLWDKTLLRLYETGELTQLWNKFLNEPYRNPPEH